MRGLLVRSIAAVSLFGLSQAAGAADIPAAPIYKAPAAVMVATWTGFYAA